MGKTLVLAEKPSVGKDIAHVLKCHKQNGSFIEGDKYVVTWAMGHLVGLADPEACGEQYKTWSMETLPMLPPKMKLTVLKGTGKQYQVVKTQLQRKDITDIIIATDAGRVQSATLAMIVGREEAIKSFVPQPYFTISAKAMNEEGKVFTLSYKTKNQKVLKDEAKVDLLIQNIEKGEAVVSELSQSDKKQYAPGLYDLTELQRDANKLFGFSPKQTLSIMQRLYENYKVLTYPRTDSRYISEDIVPTLKERLKAVAIGPYRTFASEVINKGFKVSKNFVDNSKVSDHHAIIPTEESPQLMKFSNEERKIYDLVVKRFLSVLMRPAEYTQMNVTVEVAGENFIAKGKNIKEKGWKALYDQSFEEESDEEVKGQSLPTLKKDEKVKIQNVIKTKCFTKAPARFNEATLLSAMEKPHLYINVGQKAAKTLGETGGIGTVATRADIIEKLYNMFYIEKNGKDIILFCF